MRTAALVVTVIANIVTFHATMQPQGLPLALVVVALWVAIAWLERKQFRALFARGRA